MGGWHRVTVVGGRIVLPRGVVAVPLVAAAPGLLFIVDDLWFVFLRTSGADDAFAFLADARFVDRALFWMEQGPGSGVAVASLLSLAAYLVVVLSPTVDVEPPLPRAVRRGAICTALILALLEVVALVSLAMGYVVLAIDPTSARSQNTGFVFQAPPVVLCIVVGLLAGLIAWLLWSVPTGPVDNNAGVESTAEAQPPALDATPDLEMTEVSDARPPATAGGNGADQALFRRPVRVPDADHGEPPETGSRS
jgi:hypothetical protein